jgi:YVTN family beta-propeller protein
VSIIDTGTQALTANIVSLGDIYIDDVVFTPEGDRAYIVDDYHTVYAIDTASRSVVKIITLGDDELTNSGHLPVTPDGRFVYVAGYVAGAVFVIDTTTNSVLDTIQLSEGLYQVAMAPVPGNCKAPAPPPSATPSRTASPSPTTAVPPSPTATPVTCTGDCHGDNRVTVDEILTAVNNALNGCVQSP